MELIRISDRKLKIMLTPTDMCHFELNADSFDRDNEQMHRSFRLLLEEIRDRIGFVADDRRISVQYFPSREGGCEMFISTPPPEARDETPLPSESSSAKSSRTLQLHPSKRSCTGFPRDGAYRFSNLGSLLAVCRRLLAIGYIGDSLAYRDEKKQYYLLLSMLASSPFSTPEELAFIVEYGVIENPSLLRLYLREHATLLAAPTAIAQLGPLA